MSFKKTTWFTNRIFRQIKTLIVKITILYYRIHLYSSNILRRFLMSDNDLEVPIHSLCIDSSVATVDPSDPASIPRFVEPLPIPHLTNHTSPFFCLLLRPHFLIYYSLYWIFSHLIIRISPLLIFLPNNYHSIHSSTKVYVVTLLWN